MEIVLQWLDELDDLVFAGIAVWRRARRVCLVIASIAAAGLHLLPRFGVSVDEIVTLLDVSVAALAFWLLFGAVSAGAARSRHSLARSA